MIARGLALELRTGAVDGRCEHCGYPIAGLSIRGTKFLSFPAENFGFGSQKFSASKDLPRLRIEQIIRRIEACNKNDGRNSDMIGSRPHSSAAHGMRKQFLLFQVARRIKRQRSQVARHFQMRTLPRLLDECGRDPQFLDFERIGDDRHAHDIALRLPACVQSRLDGGAVGREGEWQLRAAQKTRRQVVDIS